MGTEERTKQNPFKVPDDYFHNLEERIEEKLHKDEISYHKTSFIHIIKPYLWLTTVFVGVFVFINILLRNNISSEYKIINNHSNLTPKVSNNNILSEKDILEYLSNTDIDPEIIISRLEEKNE